METTPFHATRYWHVLPDGRVQCDLCPRECHLREGQAGHCFVRARHGDAVVLTTYGRSSGFCVDPMEKKPLNHFLPGTPVLSFGTAGCNLACQFCQNWDISKSRETETLSSEASPELVAAAAVETRSTAVAFTYNDPVIFLEYAVDTARACHQRGIKTVAKTAGYINPAAREEFFSVMDAASIDLKAFSEEFYRKYTLSSLQPVLDTILYVRHHTSAWMELTTLLIPDLNDSDEELHALTHWVAKELGPDVPLHFSAFHPDYRMLDRPATPASSLKRARNIARANGIRYAYTGNILDEDTSSTFCHGCGTAVMGRLGYTITRWHLTDDGRCRECGEPCAGVFDGPPGNWGSRRQPVDMAAMQRKLGPTP